MASYSSEDQRAATTATLEAFNASQSAITVLPRLVWFEEYRATLAAAAETGDLPDTAALVESEVIGWAVDGKLADMSDMYPEDDQPLSQLAFRYQGKPVAYSSANEVLLLFYNKDLFDAAGVAYPPSRAEEAWTWQEFVDAARRLTVDGDGNDATQAEFDADDVVTYGADFNRTLEGSWMWPILAESSGGGVISDDGKTLLLGSAETIGACQAIADLHLVHGVAPHICDADPGLWPAGAPVAECAGRPMPETLPLGQALLQERVAMLVGGQWEVGVTLSSAARQGLNYGVAVLPKMHADSRPITYNTGIVNVAFNSSAHREASQRFLRWFALEENNLELITSGIWMPVLEKWYKEAALISTWVDNDSHPDPAEYKAAVIDYALENAKPVPWYFFPGYGEIDAAMRSRSTQIWLGRKTARDAITNDVLPLVEPLFDAHRL